MNSRELWRPVVSLLVSPVDSQTRRSNPQTKEGNPGLVPQLACSFVGWASIDPEGPLPVLGVPGRGAGALGRAAGAAARAPPPERRGGVLEPAPAQEGAGASSHRPVAACLNDYVWWQFHALSRLSAA